jgi:hypothetical protein
MKTPSSEHWVERFSAAANDDAELKIVGQSFTADFSIAFAEKRYVIQMDRGRVRDVIADPRFDTVTKFGMRAPKDVWDRFFSKNPPPLYHDIFAMIMRVPEFVLDGDTLVAMQNARALHRLMTVLQAHGEHHV